MVVNGIRVQSVAPVVRQVSDQIRDMIVTGAIEEGAKLPPYRDLAAQLGISSSTVNVALRSLAREGLIVRRQGHGSFVRKQKRELKHLIYIHRFKKI